MKNYTENRIKELCKVFNITENDFKSFKNFFKTRILLADHDGSICDTNQVKDELLGDFCRSYFGELDINGKKVKDETVNHIHRSAHGLPMDGIFVQIVKDVYGKDISVKEGFKATEALNEYIKPSYINRKIYDKAAEYHELLSLIGVEQYILTGMENDMIEASLTNHKINTYFKGILGSQKKKNEWVEDILKQYPTKTIFATGDASSEYKATLRPETVFIGLDMEGTGRTDIFPPSVPVIKNYDDLVLKIVSLGKQQPTNTQLLGNIIQNQR